MQVDRAVLFSTAITVAAFVPLFTMQGVEGQIFNPMARTYGYALLGALIATFTVTPVPRLAPASRTGRGGRDHRGALAAQRSIRRSLRWSLSNRRIMVAIGRGLSCRVRGCWLPRLGTEFLPALEEGNLWIRATMPPTISLEAGMPIVNRIREILLRHPEVITVVSQHGRPDNGSDAAGFYNAEFFVPLKPFDEWPPDMTKEKLVNELQTEFAKEFVGIEFNFSQYIQDNIEEGLSGVKGANSVKIIGRDLAKLEQLGDQVMKEMAQGAGHDRSRRFPRPRPAQFEHQGRSRKGGALRAQCRRHQHRRSGGARRHSGDDAAWNPIANSASPCGSRREYRGNIDTVRNIKVGFQTPSGVNAYIPLSELANISLDTGASYIYHERNERYIPIKFSVRGRDLGGTVAEAQQRIAQNVKLPTGYRIDWAGEFEELQQAKARLEIIVPISLLLILVLALRPVQFAARQSDGARRHSVRGRRRHSGALRLRLGFQHFGRRSGSSRCSACR